MENNLFETASTLARVQAEGYRQVREQARREALEEAARLADPDPSECTGLFFDGYRAAGKQIATDIRALKDKP